MSSSVSIDTTVATTSPPKRGRGRPKKSIPKEILERIEKECSHIDNVSSMVSSQDTAIIKRLEALETSNQVTPPVRSWLEDLQKRIEGLESWKVQFEKTPAKLLDEHQASIVDLDSLTQTLWNKVTHLEERFKKQDGENRSKPSHSTVNHIQAQVYKLYNRIENLEKVDQHNNTGLYALEEKINKLDQMIKMWIWNPDPSSPLAQMLVDGKIRFTYKIVDGKPVMTYESTS